MERWQPGVLAIAVFLLSIWQEFLLGKRGKKDVQDFSLHLIDNIISLHADLKNYTYQHGCYEDFFVNDPKRRHIHKASVRDRLLHHAIYRILYPFLIKLLLWILFLVEMIKEFTER